jgi:hypothetical protein
MAQARFHDAFIAALRSGDAGPPGLAVYRNTGPKACVDALRASYPAVERLVGRAWFDAAAVVHARESPPRHPRLVEYGEAFPAFLAGFVPARAMPWLAEVARIDRMWTEAHVAADAPVLDPCWLAARAPRALARLVLEPHPSARWAWFDGCPAYTIWRRNRSVDAPQAAAFEPEWKAEGALLVRPAMEVRSLALDAADFAFIERCAAGDALPDCAAAALAADPQAQLAPLLARLLSAGTFRSVHEPTDRRSRPRRG